MGGSSEGPLPVAIVIDAEPDGVVGLDPEPWHGIEAGHPMIQDVRHEFSDRWGTPVIFNWMWRADAHIEEIYGDAGWGFGRYEAQIGQYLDEGDRIGLHVHPIRDTERVEDYVDESWTIHTVGLGIDAFETAMGRTPEMISWTRGWSSNAMLDYLGDRGVSMDLSVFPGRDRSTLIKGHDLEVRAEIPNLDDVPPRPYYPSSTDWRVPADTPGTGTWIVPYSATAVDAWMNPVVRLGRRLVGRPIRSRIEHNYLFASPRRAFRPYVDDLVTEPKPYLTLNVRSSRFSRETGDGLRKCLLAIEHIRDRHGCVLADPEMIRQQCAI